MCLINLGKWYYECWQVHSTRRTLLAALFPNAFTSLYNHKRCVWLGRSAFFFVNGKRWASKIGKIKAPIQLTNEKWPIWYLFFSLCPLVFCWRTLELKWNQRFYLPALSYLGPAGSLTYADMTCHVIKNHSACLTILITSKFSMTGIISECL